MRTYQSTLLGGLLLLGSFAVSAQEINASQVPDPVQQAFKAKFFKATDIEWKKEGDQYKISFDIGNDDHDAFYNASGKLVSHSYEILKSQLPASIRAAVKKEFPNHRIDDVDKIERDGAVTYKVDLDGRPDMKSVFGADGKLISKVEDD